MWFDIFEMKSTESPKIFFAMKFLKKLLMKKQKKWDRFWELGGFVFLFNIYLSHSTEILIMPEK